MYKRASVSVRLLYGLFLLHGTVSSAISYEMNRLINELREFVSKA